MMLVCAAVPDGADTNLVSGPCDMSDAWAQHEKSSCQRDCVAVSVSCLRGVAGVRNIERREGNGEDETFDIVTPASSIKMLLPLGLTHTTSYSVRGKSATSNTTQVTRAATTSTTASRWLCAIHDDHFRGPLYRRLVLPFPPSRPALFTQPMSPRPINTLQISFSCCSSHKETVLKDTKVKGKNDTREER